jgi:excisionase family DNA binding protein
MSVSLSVSEAAAALDISERTVWRRIKDGRLRSVRDGRTVRVLLEPGEGHAHAVGEAVVAYGTTPVADPLVGPWPYTAENVALHRERLRLRRLAALANLQAIAGTTRPDPDGWTVVEYLREWRDPDAEPDAAGDAP